MRPARTVLSSSVNAVELRIAIFADRTFRYPPNVDATLSRLFASKFVNVQIALGNTEIMLTQMKWLSGRLRSPGNDRIGRHQ
jgi:hypothetical protein